MQQKKDYELVKEKLVILCFFSFILSSIFGYLSYFLFRKPQKLEKILQQKSKELLNSREQFRVNSELLTSVLESPQNIVIFSLDRFYNYVAFNDNYRKLIDDLYGIPIRKGMNVFDVVPKKNRALLMVNYNRALNGESFDFTQEIVGQDLKNYFWQNWFSPIKDNHKHIIGLTVFSMNITKRIKAEAELKRNEGRLRTLISSSPYCIHELDVEGRLISINKAGIEMFKLDSPDQLIGRYYPVLIGKNRSTMIDHLLNKTLTGESTMFEFSTWENYYQSQMIPLKNEDNVVVRIMGITQDITERKKSEAFIENSLKEKTTLLAEIHHRVKNNLAIVSGLLELQKVEVNDKQLSDIFDQSINRIISIAMVHELMYNTEDLSSVYVDTYLHKLVPAISATMQYRNQHVEFKLDITHYKLNINQTIPLGLLLNELITNSFKYAFNTNTNNIISIELETFRQGLKVRYCDNGQGFPEEIDFNNPINLGLNLIHAQLKQLDADYTVDTDCKFNLEFEFMTTDRGSHSNF
jgi:PAS domain S-box-containing protein